MPIRFSLITLPEESDSVPKVAVFISEVSYGLHSRLVKNKLGVSGGLVQGISDRDTEASVGVAVDDKVSPGLLDVVGEVLLSVGGVVGDGAVGEDVENERELGSVANIGIQTEGVVLTPAIK